MDLLTLRRHVKVVATLVHVETTRCTSHRILELCQDSSPSEIRRCHFVPAQHVPIVLLLNPPHVVTTGGMCLEGYLTGMAGHKAHTLWQQYTKRRQHIGAVEPLSEQQEEDMLASVRLSFHGFRLQTIAGMENKGKDQLFYRTSMARYHGLSRTGQNLMACYGFMIPRTTCASRRADKSSGGDVSSFQRRSEDAGIHVGWQGVPGPIT
jgi:hypothetical protein